MEAQQDNHVNENKYRTPPCEVLYGLRPQTTTCEEARCSNLVKACSRVGYEALNVLCCVALHTCHRFNTTHTKNIQHTQQHTHQHRALIAYKQPHKCNNKHHNKISFKSRVRRAWYKTYSVSRPTASLISREPLCFLRDLNTSSGIDSMYSSKSVSSCCCSSVPACLSIRFLASRFSPPVNTIHA